MRSTSDVAIHINDELVEERSRLLGPHPPTGGIKGPEQGVNSRRVEAAAEIASGGRIGDALGANRVREDLILTTQFEILQTRAATQDVVGNGQHMIGFVIVQVQFRQWHALVNDLDQPQTADQHVNGSEPPRTSMPRVRSAIS